MKRLDYLENDIIFDRLEDKFANDENEDNIEEDNCLLLNKCLINNDIINNNDSINRDNIITNNSFKNNKLFKLIISKYFYINLFVLFAIVILILLFIYIIKDNTKDIFYWIEKQNVFIICAIFLIFFIIVSFPFIIGYLILSLIIGYLLGILKGLFIVVIGANCGIFVAHNIIRCFNKRYPMKWLITSKNGRFRLLFSVISIISGPRAFKIVLLTRLTPIPFGMQNYIFGISAVPLKAYHLASLLGLLPAQIVNVYLGSTFRSIHDVLEHNTPPSAYAIFVIQITIAVLLMIWVIQKAKTELSEALLSNIDGDPDIINFEV